MSKKTITGRLKVIMRTDRALKFVWEAGPWLAITNYSLLALQGILPLVSLWLMKLIVDALIPALSSPDKAGAFKTVMIPVCYAAGVALIHTVISAISGSIREIQSRAVEDHVFHSLQTRSVETDLEYYDNPGYFDTLHKAQREGPYRTEKIVNGLADVIVNIITLGGVLALLVTFHWLIPIFLLAAALPGIGVRLFFSGKRYRWKQKYTRTERLSDYYHWVLTGEPFAREVRLFGLGGQFITRFGAVRKLLRNDKIRMATEHSLWDVLAQSITVAAVFASLGWIVWRCIHGTVSPGEFVMYFQAFQRGLSYLSQTLGGIAGLYEDTLFITDFYRFLDMKSNICDPESPAEIPAAMTSGITFDRVSFSYPGNDRHVLDGVSFSVKPGEVVALVGKNGSGKSTLMKLLCRLYDPAGGRITIDGNALTQFRVRDLRSKISALFQDYVKYQLTAGENIRLGDPDRETGRESVQAAADMAGVHEMIQDLPEGYDTPLGRWVNEGEELSSGQWQKVALARAFFRKSDIIILDEPASSLDPESEYKVFSRFRELLKDRTGFIISHRFSTVAMADRIIVLDSGKVIESGTHTELMTANGVYSELYRKQSESYRN